MTNTIDTEKLSGLVNRVVNNKLQGKDEEVFKAYMKETFGNGTPSQHQLHQFNQIIIREAEVLAQQRSAEVLSILADSENLNARDNYVYEIPVDLEAKWLWSANGTSVEHVRVGGKRNRQIQREKFSTGMYYEVTSLADGDVEDFNKLVSKAADALVQLKLQQVSRLFQAAVASGQIPLKNQLSGSNLTLEQFVKFSSRFQRFGGRPVFVADTLLVDHFALQLPANAVYQNLLYDDKRQQLLDDLNVTQIARTTTVNLTNPWILSTYGKDTERTQLPVNEGYMFAGGVGFKPVKIVQFGAPTQYTEFDYNLERVEVKMTVELGVDFVIGETVGFVKDDAVVL